MLEFFVVGGYCIKHDFPTKLINESKFSWDLLEYLLDISKMTNRLKYKVAKGGTIGAMSIHTCRKWGAVGATNRVSHMIIYPHLYLHHIFILSPLHPHCIPIIISPFYLHYVPHYCISPLHLHYILQIRTVSPIISASKFTMIPIIIWMFPKQMVPQIIQN